MAELNVQFVRPDRALYEGPAASLLLATYTGEMGIYPGHAAEIVALGDGVVRMMLTEAEGGGIRRVVVSGGYAEVDNDQVIILADHARRTDDIEPETVARATRSSGRSSPARRATPGARTTRTKSIGVIFC